MAGENLDRLTASVYAPPPAKAPWRLEDLLPGAALRYYGSGRRALAAGLKAAGVRFGDAVLLPGLICRDLLSALAAVGAGPVYYGVDENLRPAADPKDWPAAAAVVAVNYFGFDQDIAPFRRYCELRGSVLIEDNAHGLFSRDARGRPLGTRSDLGLLSLRKSLPLPDGAALILAPAGGRIAPPAQIPFNAPDGARYLLKQSCRRAAGLLGARCAFQGLSLWRRLRDLRPKGPASTPQSEQALPLPENPCGQLSRAMTVADPELEARRRAALYALTARLLQDAGVAPVFPSLPDHVVPYAYAFRAGTAAAAKAESLLGQRGLASLPWPDLPSSLEASAPEHYRDIRLVHFLW